jgi:hypothetical protein
MSESLRNRPTCSLPLKDADPQQNNYNWTKALQSASDWIWSGNLNPVAFPNNLARFFLQIPGVFEQQLNFSTTLIFDEPSFRNGVQMSGYLPRVARELVISFIAQQRRCQYSMTHHAILGTLTASKHGLATNDIANKWSNLLTFEQNSEVYTPIELALLRFASKFSTDPKSYSDENYENLRETLRKHNNQVYWNEAGWMERIKAARKGFALATARGKTTDQAYLTAHDTSENISTSMPAEDNERKINAQVVELAFLCLQFVALTGVFSSLNISDEDFLGGVFQNVVPQQVQTVITSILNGTTSGMPQLMPTRVQPPVREIVAGQVHVEPTMPRCRRIPLISWEIDPTQGTRDKGLAIGGVQVGTYGWSFGAFFPGSLPYLLMHHGELARFEAPYSLPLLFNEDEWRNGTQTSGYNRPPTKELLIQKVYHLVRSRYGAEHHTMFFFNAILQHYGAGAFRLPEMTDEEHSVALKIAMKKAESMVLYVSSHREAPANTFTSLHLAMLDWVEAIVTQPHSAHNYEKALRNELEAENRREIGAGLRILDMVGKANEVDAMKRLVDHQIAEMAMITGHMDGLGRVLTILQLESEFPVNMFEPNLGPDSIIAFKSTGAMNSRPGLFDVLHFMQIPDSVLTYNELMLNPAVNKSVRDKLGVDPKANINMSSKIASLTAEF